MLVRNLNGYFRFKFSSHVNSFKAPLTHVTGSKTSFVGVAKARQASSSFHHFFGIAKERENLNNAVSSMLKLLSDEKALKNLLYHGDNHAIGNYLYRRFVFWLNAYAKTNSFFLHDYFSGKQDLNFVCRDFIKFCFSQNIFLDERSTLASFRHHNELSDNAVKKELMKISPKNTINLLGFGLDEGHYEKSLAQFLISHGKSESVNLFGFDPYAKKSSGIKYLSCEQLAGENAPRFDVIIARWVLHHVDLKKRWSEFSNCLKQCNSDAMILIVEHGFLKDQASFLDKKLSDFLNATFDVIANIGLRPRYFTDTVPDMGAHFFIGYLEPKDIEEIKNVISSIVLEKTYDVGPEFPNQTVCCMRTAC